MPTPEERLRGLGLRLPDPHLPVGTYRMSRRTGSQVWLAGHGAFRDGRPVHVGRLGDTLTTAQGAAAARDVALHLLATLRAELGELSRVTAAAKVVVLVNATPAFTEQHLVADGATDLLVQVFGEDVGRPVRTAMGVASLPLGFAVEVEALFEVA